jgi:NAD dependent epimerase/dehydratase family enzyme
MSDMLLASQCVAAVAAEAAGFQFQHGQLAEALGDLLRG